ncbi:helix-turn-helix domain-containing protein [Xanthomonas citri pv. malvacearum]|uniref:phage replication protein n=1 Tax=Xanthomonas citri TaxID=346 RepID=UPI0022AECEAE|nr:phage replication protein [Xanthomonas citri]WAW90106.1 helix-turn-helix domain-containing protein [Xanthomonas citri pv. malvacearum]
MTPNKEQRETPAGQGGGDAAMREGSPEKVSRSNGMEIVRAPRKGQFEIIPHTVLRDSRLSYRARGVLVRLLSNADGYRMSAIDLAREGPEGRDAIYNALSELERAGYLLRRRQQDAKGRWRTQGFVTDTPFAFEWTNSSTDDGFSGVGNPVIGDPGIGEPAAGHSGVNSTTTKTSTNSFTKTSTSTNQHMIGSAKERKDGSGKGRPEVMHGLYCFGDRDRGQIAELVREFGVSSVERAARHVTKLDSRGRKVAFVSEARHWLGNNGNSAAKHLTDIAEMLGRSMSIESP